MKLSATIEGEGDPLAILHGLFGSGRNWATAAKHLAARWRTLALDLRNHGSSPWADGMGYRDMAADVWETLEGEDAASASVILGHSMGGKTAMVAALMRPGEVRALIVVDIAPVAYGHSNAEYIEAMRAVDLGAVSRRAEADAALATAVPEAGLRGFLLQNLAFEDGAARWRIDLDAIEAGMETLMAFPYAQGAARYDGPALFIGGSRSDYLRPEHEDAIKAFFPAARIETIDGAGHWVHAEAPAAFMAAVEGFLAEV
jgi:pimeloyl-ACP methyl ester carboxylesterase